MWKVVQIAVTALNKFAAYWGETLIGRAVVDADFLTSILTMSVMTSLCVVHSQLWTASGPMCFIEKSWSYELNILFAAWLGHQEDCWVLTHLNCTPKHKFYLWFCLPYEIWVSMSSLSWVLFDLRIRKGKFAQRGSNKCKLETDEGRGQETKLYVWRGQHGAQAGYSCSLSVTRWHIVDNLQIVWACCSLAHPHEIKLNETQGGQTPPLV